MTLLNQVNKLLVTPCIVAMEWSCFGISVSRPRLAALLAIAAGVGGASVNTPMCSSLQPYVLQPATLCAPVCNPCMRQPRYWCAVHAAFVHAPSCNPPATLREQVNDVSVTTAGCLASCATLPLNAAYKAPTPTLTLALTLALA